MRSDRWKLFPGLFPLEEEEDNGACWHLKSDLFSKVVTTVDSYVVLLLLFFRYAEIPLYVTLFASLGTACMG